MPAPLRRIIVSGGSRGLGRATALAFAGQGAAIGLLARDPARLQATAAELLAAGAASVSSVPADTADPAAVDEAVRTLIDAIGGVDTLVNAAAVPAGTIVEPGIEDYDETHLRREIETKALGYLRTTKAVAPTLIAQGWGRIVNIAGQSTFHTGSISSTARNAAVVAITKNLAAELGPHGITVNVVHPGFTITEGTPQTLARIADRRGVTPEQAAADIADRSTIKSLATASEVAEVIRFLASDAGRIVNGESLSVGGGAAGYIFHY